MLKSKVPSTFPCGTPNFVINFLTVTIVHLNSMFLIPDVCLKPVQKEPPRLNFTRFFHQFGMMSCIKAFAILSCIYRFFKGKTMLPGGKELCAITIFSKLDKVTNIFKNGSSNNFVTGR